MDEFALTIIYQQLQEEPNTIRLETIQTILTNKDYPKHSRVQVASKMYNILLKTVHLTDHTRTLEEHLFDYIVS